MGRCPPPVARLVVLASLTEETFKGPVHRQPRISGQAAAGAGPARHRIPDGDLAAILERALDLLIEDVKKERFALGPEGPAGAEGGCRQLAPHPRCDQAGGLRTRRRALHVRGRAGSALRRDWSAGIRSCGRICARTGTMSTESGCFAARTTSTRQSRSTDGPSWNERGRHPWYAELAPDDLGRRGGQVRPAGGKERQRSFFC